MNQPLIKPFELPQDVRDALADDATDLFHPSVQRALDRASEAALTAMDWDAKQGNADPAGWLFTASAAYHELQGHLYEEASDNCGAPSSPDVFLAIVANADRCCALGGRADISLLRHLVHLVQRDPGEPDDPMDGVRRQLYSQLLETETRYSALEGVVLPDKNEMAGLLVARAGLDGERIGLRRAFALTLGLTPDHTPDWEESVRAAFALWQATR